MLLRQQWRQKLPVCDETMRGSVKWVRECCENGISPYHNMRGWPIPATTIETTSCGCDNDIMT
jgi:hypothetical protein